MRIKSSQSGNGLLDFLIKLIANHGPALATTAASKVVDKVAEKTGEAVGNKIADKINPKQKMGSGFYITHAERDKPYGILKYYNEELRKVENMVGDGSTTNKQINAAGKKLLGRKFFGVFASDNINMLSKSLDEGEYAIINTQNSSQPGMHWLALVKKSGNLVMFDSFGRRHAKLSPEFIGLPIIDGESDVTQSFNENNCGARALAWLLLYDKYKDRVINIL